MIRYRLVPAVVLLLVVGSGCGVGVDPVPRPLEPMTTVPLQPAPTVVSRPDDGSAPCLPGEGLPTPSPDAPPSSPPPSTPPLTVTEPC